MRVTVIQESHEQPILIFFLSQKRWIMTDIPRKFLNLIPELISEVFGIHLHLHRPFVSVSSSRIAFLKEITCHSVKHVDFFTHEHLWILRASNEELLVWGARLQLRILSNILFPGHLGVDQILEVVIIVLNSHLVLHWLLPQESPERLDLGHRIRLGHDRFFVWSRTFELLDSHSELTTFCILWHFIDKLINWFKRTLVKNELAVRHLVSVGVLAFYLLRALLTTSSWLLRFQDRSVDLLELHVVSATVRIQHVLVIVLSQVELLYILRLLCSLAFVDINSRWVFRQLRTTNVAASQMSRDILVTESIMELRDVLL